MQAEREGAAACIPTEMSALKITEMRDNRRAGDLAAKPKPRERPDAGSSAGGGAVLQPERYAWAECECGRALP